MALVSIIMPVHNGAVYLAEAIQSILAQTYLGWELIIVDDGSTDDSLTIANEFAHQDDRIRVLHQANRGLPGALNAGLRRATGRYVAVLAQDDQWLPSYLQTTVAVLEANPEAGAVYALAQMMDINGHNLPQRVGRIVTPDQLYDRLIDGNFILACTVMMRRSALDAVGWYDETLYSEDWDLWLRLAAAYPILAVPDVLLRYRVHDKNMTAQLAKMEQCMFAVVRKHFGNSDDVSTWPGIRRRAYAGVYCRCAIDHAAAGDLSRSASYLERAFKLWPAWAERPDPYYEIGCAHQPLGERGDLAKLDLDLATTAVKTVLAELFGNLSTADPLRRRRRAIYALAYLVLTQLSLGRGAHQSARRFLFRAAVQDPRCLLHRAYMGTVLRALCGSYIRCVRAHHADALSQ